MCGGRSLLKACSLLLLGLVWGAAQGGCLSDEREAVAEMEKSAFIKGLPNEQRRVFVEWLLLRKAGMTHGVILGSKALSVPHRRTQGGKEKAPGQPQTVAPKRAG